MAPTVSKVMIGDWLLVDGKVTKVTRENIDYVLNTLCQPIPLTEETLEKNGFEWDEVTNKMCKGWSGEFIGVTHHVDGGYQVVITKNSPTTLVNVVVKYVHELQRLADLCDIDCEFTHVIYKGFV